MNRVFVDTSGFFALLVPEDRHHAQARALYLRANAEQWSLATTNLVVVETYALLGNSRSHAGRQPPSASWI